MDLDSMEPMSQKPGEPGSSTDEQDRQALRAKMWRILRDERRIERAIEPESRLAQEIQASTNDVARHFLGELPKHCNMLCAAVDDALEGLERLDPKLPFSGLLIARGLLEAAADLYWLCDPGIDARERVRRTFLTYLRQQETLVRQLEQFAARIPRDASDVGVALDTAIAEGWTLLDQIAKEMAGAGYELRTSTKVGSKYSVGDPKPTIAKLVDRLITDVLGKTGINLYSSHSAVAHAEGEGLGSLLLLSDYISTANGTRYAYGLDDAAWEERVLVPATSAAAGGFYAWASLAYPHGLREDEASA